MEVFQHLALGFQVAMSPENLFYCLVGALLGTLIGVLPGLGPSATIAILLPLTFSLPATGAMIMLAGIYYGSQYGGSTTAILVNVPGEASSVVTAIDGYQMARQGKAGEALAIAALGSFFAGCVATLLIALIAVPIGAMALKFGAPEYFALMVFGLTAVVALAHGSVIKSIAIMLVGIAFGLVGLDVYSGSERYMFGMAELSDGIQFVPVSMGIFGIAEILRNIESPPATRTVVAPALSRLWPSAVTLRRVVAPVLRGTAIGSIIGILPGSGGTLSSFIAYAVERKVSRAPETFGKGAPEGVASPESANNAGAQTSFIPMLTLGIPSNAVMALMIGALMILGVTPGPLFMQSKPDLFWGLIVSMWIGNAMLVIINLPLIGIWVQLLKVPYRFLFPSILLLTSIGAYTLTNSAFNVLVLFVASTFGYVLYRLKFEPAPFLLGFILGPLLEENLRRSMLLFRGDPARFLERPISATLLALTALTIIAVFLPSFSRGRKQMMDNVEGEN